MKRFVLAVLSLAFCAAVTAKQPEKFRDDTILVKPEKGVSLPQLDREHRKLGAKATRTFKGIGNLQIVKLPKGLSVEKAIAHYLKSGKVEYAEPDYEVQAVDCNPPASPPNDPNFLNGILWAMHNYGQNGGTCNADIDAPEGWQVATSAQPVIVAVIDTGIRYTHEDLAANMWTNPCVSCPVNGVVYTNDVYGFNAINDTGDPWDDHFHGTHCAGTIGGIGNNNKGVVGVAWNVRLMALKFLNSGGSGWTSDAIKCVDYARIKGAKVMSNSWGGGGASQGLLDAILAARDAGMIFVAAAGNNNRDIDPSPFYPASYSLDADNVVTVAATDRNDTRASFSNWGTNSVHLGAPGVDIYSSYNTTDSAYAYLSGTSMATPHVSGVCAMLFAEYPTLAYSNIIQRLLRSVDYTAAMQGKVSTGGRLNFGRAIRDPIADFTASISPTQALLVAFSDRSLTDTDAITQELLEFGDGYSSADPNVSYIYPNAGTFTATLTVQNGSGSTSVKKRNLYIPPVISNLSVSPGIGLIDPSGYYGGPFSPAGRTFTLLNMGSDVMTWSASTPANWISLSATNGNLTPGASAAVDVSFNAVTDQLFPGIYETSVLFSNLTGLGSTTRGVRLQVKEPPGTFTITPAEDYFAEGDEGGPYLPEQKVYTLHNNSAEFGFEWSVAQSEIWPNISPQDGTLYPGQSADVTLTIDPAHPIFIGTNNATVFFNDDTTQETQQRNVTAVANQILYVTPDEMFLSYGSEGGPFTPDSKTYTLLYTGSGTFNWFAESNFWIWEVNPSSGSLLSNQTVDVTVSLSNDVNTLYSETWDGVVRFYNADNDHLHQERVTQLLVFDGAGQLYVEPAQGFTTTGPRGGPFNPASKIYQLSWLGVAPIDWEVVPGNSWLTVSPPSGQLNDGGSVNVTVSLNNDAIFLPRGTNTSSLIFRSTNGVIYATLPVSLIATQVPSGTMSITPNEHFYGQGPVGGPFSPTNKLYTVSYSGPAPLHWVAFPNDDYFDATPNSGVLTNGQSVSVTVYLTPYANQLPDNLYEEVMVFVDTDNDVVVFRGVDLDVGSAGVLGVSPASDFSSSGPQGGPFTPSSKNYTLQNTGGHWLSWSATKASTWLTLSPNSGSIPPGGSSSMTVSMNANANNLGQGGHSDTIDFKNTISGNGNTTRQVSLDVGLPGVMLVTPATNLVSSGTQGGPFSPTQQVYTIQNVGAGTLNWDVLKGQTWVTLTSQFGALAPGASTNITVTINTNANALAAGNYLDFIFFGNTDNGDGNATRQVQLTVNPQPGNLSVSPAGGLTSSGTQGGPFTPASQTYTLQNTGGVTISLNVTKTSNWVAISPPPGSLAPGASTNITVSIHSNANSLTPGNYSDTVTFTNTSNGNGSTTRPVSLTVNAPPGVLSVTPAGNLSSSGCQGGPFSPSGTTYTLQNTGGQSINWTASKSQSWVSLSAASGSLAAGASTNVSVSINSGANSLAAGNYSDTVSFTNTTNGAGNSTRSVSLSVTAATLNAPGNLTATALSGPAVRLNWADNSTCEDGVAVERALKSGNSFGAFSQIGTTGPDATQYTDSTVQANKTYRYRVRSFRGSNFSAYSNTVDIKP